MKKIGFFDTKPYDKTYFDRKNEAFGFEIHYFEPRLSAETAVLAKNCDGVVAFVNDAIDQETIQMLNEYDIHLLVMRCAGYNNVDLKAAYGKIHVARVPAYSPYAVAEHTMAMLLTLNRQLHRAYNRTREYNFSLNGLVGFDLKGKVIGVVGTGKIGRTFMNICGGFEMEILAYDLYPATDVGINYVSFEELCRKSDIISLHCPLTKESHYLLNETSFQWMKDGAYILNTSRGALIDSAALVEAIKSGKVGAAGLDVYEEETEFFYEDNSNMVLQDDTLARLITMPNVLVTSHQAFLTEEALSNIAQITLENLKEYFNGEVLTNEICYHCVH